MANEELMRELPKDIEKASVPGPFHIKTYPGSHSIVVLTCELVTCGGLDSKDNADNLARVLNEVWNNHFDRLRNLDSNNSPAWVLT